jgi:propionyl-CoA synthetase
MTETPGYYTTGDAGYFDNDGYLNVMTRLDDIINTAGHRLSTAQMEEELLRHPGVAEAAVVAKI